MDLEDELVLLKAKALIERCRVLDRPRVLAKFLSDPTAPLSRFHRSIIFESEHAQLLRDVDQARQAAKETREAQARARIPVEAALCPTGIVFRNELLRELNAHAIDVAVKYGITVVRHDRGACGTANQETRSISVPAATSEICYAIVLHEIAHVVCPEADSRQHHYRIEKHDDGRRSIISPGGETAAWRWASENAIHWTLPMQERMYQSLSRHRPDATPDERQTMVACVRASCFRITGKGWSFGELDSKCKELTGD